METLVGLQGKASSWGKDRGTDRLWVENQSHLASHTDDQDFQLQEGLEKSAMTQRRRLPRARV